MSLLSYLLESVAPMTTLRVVSPWSGNFLVSWGSPFILGWRGAGPTLVTSRGESPGPVPGASPGASRGPRREATPRGPGGGPRDGPGRLTPGGDQRGTCPALTKDKG